MVKQGNRELSDQLHSDNLHATERILDSSLLEGRTSEYGRLSPTNTSLHQTSAHETFHLRRNLANDDGQDLARMDSKGTDNTSMYSKNSIFTKKENRLSHNASHYSKDSFYGK